MTRVTTLDALRPIVDTALDAGIIIDGDSVVLAWNDVATRTFGWTKDEAIGRSLFELIIPEELRQQHIRGLRRAAQSDLPTLAKRYLLEGLTKDARRIPVELSITSFQLKGEQQRIFLGFARDVSERIKSEWLLRQRARQAELLFQISAKMSETESVEEGFKACLEAICDISGWEIGHVFLIGDGQNGESVPIPTNVWYHSDKRHEGNYLALKKATAELNYVNVESLPSVIIRTGEPAWFSDIRVESEYFIRLRSALASGVTAAFAFPVKYRGSVVAVLEFFSDEQVELDPDLMNTVKVISEQLGRVFERKRRDELQKTLVDELNHRVKNNLATVQSIAQQTLKTAQNPDEFVQTFTARLRALSEAHNILNRHKWEDARLAEVVDRTLQPYLDQVDYGGPSVNLVPSYIISLHLIFHELATNAAKYGALSTPHGHVSVRWCFIEEDGKQNVYLVWQESGGPPVQSPERLGFGSKLIERGARWDLGARVKMDYQPDGFVCEIHIPCSSKVRPCKSHAPSINEIVEFREPAKLA